MILLNISFLIVDIKITKTKNKPSLQYEIIFIWDLYELNLILMKIYIQKIIYFQIKHL